MHDDNDNLFPFDWITSCSNSINEKYQKYKIGDKEYPCLYRTSGLGHKDLLKDDQVLDVIVDFISTIH